jgi:hypothetical protein
MAKSRCKRTPKTVLKLPDLEQSKSAVLNGLTSASSKRSYDHAIREFIDNWTVGAGITASPLLRSINKAGRIWGTALLQR